MKNLLSLFFIIAAFSASAQVPNWVPAEPDSVKIGVLRNGVVNQVKMGDLMRNRVSTTKYTADSLRNEAVYFHYKEGLISGGIVTLNTGMTLDVTAAIYSLINVIHYSTAGQITLNASDPSLPRKDIIAVNDLNQIIKITGTPGINPIEPQLDPLTQVKLTVLDIPAGATSPSISSTVIYDENTEWTETTGGTITANANSTLRAIHGTKSVLISSFSSGSYVKFKTATSPINVIDLSSLKFYFYLQSAWSNNNNLSIQLFRNNVSVSNAPIISLNKSAIGTWQTLAQAAFNFTGTSFDEVRFIFSGSSSTQVSLDYVQAQGGIGGNPNTAAEVDPFYSANGATQAALRDTAIALRSAIGTGGGSSLFGTGYVRQSGSSTSYDNRNFVYGATQINGSTLVLLKDVLNDTIIYEGGGIATEADPVFLAHVASSITSTNISNWNTAFGWGNHALAGYLTNITGKITAGTGTTITGSGTSGSPYVINSSATGGITGGSIAWPGTIFTTPTTGTVASNSITFSPALASQSAKTFFGAQTTGTPSFLANTVLDSTWITALHTQAYYDARYAAIGSSGSGSSSVWGLNGNLITTGMNPPEFIGTTNQASLIVKTNGLTRIIVDTAGYMAVNATPSTVYRLLVGGTLGASSLSASGNVGGGTSFFSSYTITPTIYGGFSGNGTLTLIGNSSGSGNTATSPNVVVKVGNNSTTTALTALNNGMLMFNSTVEYADNAAAVAAGLAVGTVYRTGDLLKIVH